MTTLAPRQFQRIASIARERWGLHLGERKQTLVANRLSSFLLSSRFRDVEEYLRHLERGASNEDLLVLFDILSTNVTSFFRDQPHFDYLEREFYTPRARGTLTSPGRSIRIWSAACSTGQEPYSLAMHAIEHLPDLATWDLRILGTDLSNFAVAEATTGRYTAESASGGLNGIGPERLRRHFVSARSGDQRVYEVAPAVRALVRIARLNLMDPWPFKGRFDVIFCRNVMIYFDTATRRALVRRFHEVLHPGGILAIGSAETLAGLDVPFRAVQPSVYVRA